jgi:hypothetical protein
MKTLFAILLSLFFVGCVTPQPVDPDADELPGKHSHLNLGNGNFKITYDMNGYSIPLEKRETFLLKKCAKVAKDHGFDYFVVVESNDLETDKKVISGASYDYNSAFGVSRVKSTIINRATVKMYKAGSQPENSIEAKAIWEQLKGFN